VGVRFRKADLHGDGLYPLGRAGLEGTCWACHGSQTTEAAPAPDLRGRTATSEVSVGLHALHQARGSYANAVPCESCHKVPKGDGEAGHFDSDLPAEVVFSDRARGKTDDPTLDTQPVWNRAAATCTSVYCHGALPGAAVTAWPWTQKLGTALACTSCHGLPPTTLRKGGTHTSDTDCASCHSSAYDSNGNLDPSRHNNGEVD
jgi:predicted CxxxxCH...CXXCH cytochrome family protein